MSQLSVVTHDSGPAFLERAGSFLTVAEAENMLLLGIAGELQRYESAAPPPLLTVEEDGAVVMAALQTPPHALVVSRAADKAVKALTDELARRNVALPGINGPAETAAAFQKRWSQRTGVAFDRTCGFGFIG